MTTDKLNKTTVCRASVAGSQAFDHGCPRNPMLDIGFTGLLLDSFGEVKSQEVVDSLKNIWLSSWDAACLCC